MDSLLDTILSDNNIEEFFVIDDDPLSGIYDYYTNNEHETPVLKKIDNEKPSIVSKCSGQGVLTALHIATTYASLASQRLNYLSSLPENQKKKIWNMGAEKIWFGKYRRNRLINIRNRMWKIVKLLQSPMLVIQCNWNKKFYGKAFPGNPTITLGYYWKNTKNSHLNKTQTLIHEAAHIRGAVLGAELRKKYGPGNALDRANKNPGIAIRTADNIGFYAVCRASTHDCCKAPDAYNVNSCP